MLSPTMVTDKEELEFLEKFRTLRQKKHAEMIVAYKSGKLVKLWVTEKTDLEMNFREGAER